MISVRRIRHGDGSAFGRVRLKALLADPETFGSTYDREVNRSVDEWEMRATAGAIGDTQFLAVAESGNEFVGMAGAYQVDEQPAARELYGMWVTPEVRSTGIGSRLVDAVTEWSVQAGAETVSLWVVEGNLSARRLYLSCGFTDTGSTQILPLDSSLTEVRMSMQLGQS